MIRFFIQAMFAILGTAADIGTIIQDVQKSDRAKRTRKQSERKLSTASKGIPSEGKFTTVNKPNPLFLAILLMMLVCGLWVEWRGGA